MFKTPLRWRSAMASLVPFVMMGTAAGQGHQDLGDVARMINELFSPPVMINADTRFEGVRSTTTSEMVFHYTLVYMTVNSELLPPVVAKLKESLSTSACDQKDWRKFLGAGISITVLYNTIDGEEVLRITTSPETCGLSS